MSPSVAIGDQTASRNREKSDGADVAASCGAVVLCCDAPRVSQTQVQALLVAVVVLQLEVVRLDVVLGVGHEVVLQVCGFACCNEMGTLLFFCFFSSF